MTLPTETLKALESLIYGDVEDLVTLHGEENRRSVLLTKAMLMELGTEHLEWLKPILALAWSQGFRAEKYRSNLNGDYLGATRNPYEEEV